MCLFLFELALVSSLLAAYGQEQYSYVQKWGSPGSGDGQFSEPTRIAIDSTDNVYVLDSGQNSVQKFSSNGTLILKWDSSGSSSGQFKNPTDIALDPVENIYVLDMANPFVKKFSGDGTFMNSWGELVEKLNRHMALHPAFATLVEPSGMAVDSSGKVYITDRNVHLIKIYTIDGDIIDTVGSNGIEEGQFSFPGSIAFDDSGNFYVIDSGNHRIQKFSNDGTFITKWGSQGSGDGQLNNPSGITTDSTGNVYVADTGNSRIQVFAFTPPT